MTNTCNSTSHSSEVLSQWQSFIQRTGPCGKVASVDGHSLDIATVVAVSRYGGLAALHEKTTQAILKGAEFLHSGLAQGEIIYGVNTGFGGSADTRTKEVEELQATLIRELHSGIIVNAPFTANIPDPGDSHSSDDRSVILWLKENAIRCTDASSNTYMPEAWARAAILVRINSLASGHSGVRPILINTMADLLKKNIIPRIPLRGSISASGDLMPLSYIGGTIQGKASITVWATGKTGRRVTTADIALAEASLKPIKLGPKEGLAMINGTAVSTGVAALAIHDANSLAALSQILTAMSVEALGGTDESFDPFFSIVRPHPGQREVARNIRCFLTDSKLVKHNHGLKTGALRQDRYAIRTAPQWLGPILEDLELALRQVTIECNSVTDNPLINFGLETAGETKVLHGGNFQAKAITSAMEKVRLAIQTIGQMLFAQCTEIINPRLNYGLPPNLVLDEPSQSFLLKPLDIMIAALQSELGYLSNPAGTHVQSAEMGNQSLNSLGLISARYTHTALDVLSQLASAHLFALCQALDLQALKVKYFEAIQPIIIATTADILSQPLEESLAFNATAESLNTTHSLRSMSNSRDTKYEQGRESLRSLKTNRNTTYQPEPCTNNPTEEVLRHDFQSDMPSSKKRKLSSSYSEKCNSSVLHNPKNSMPGKLIEDLHALFWKEFEKQFDQTTTMDSVERFPAIFRSLQPIALDFLSAPNTVLAVRKWTEQCSESALKLFVHTRESYHASPDASHLLGKASSRMYKFIRKELRVPLLRTSMLRIPPKNDPRAAGDQDLLDDGLKTNGIDTAKPSLTTGDLITTIYESIRTGELYLPVMDCLAEAEKA